MNITFKNVGQGDSIIIEWDDEVKKIGIIDCNLVNGKNPVLEYLKIAKYEVIDFLIISHPHDDHYSGFTQLLDYVEATGIAVNWFGHTISQTGKAYWKYFELGVQATRDLDYILKKAIQLKKTGLLKKWEIPIEKWRIQLSEEVYLESLSPSHDEIQKFMEIVDLDPDLNKKQASGAANLLSTVFKISKGSNNILLTSDAVLETFKRLHDEKVLHGINFKSIQIPHHGSIKNFSEDFWASLTNTDIEKIAVASSGQNLKYKHPHLEVLKKIESYKFKIHCTNIVHGMQEYVESVRKSLVLDGVSEVLDDNLIGGDKTFSF
jgi:beta-lactamase superfamily II metal-dependent hydrolase